MTMHVQNGNVFAHKTSERAIVQQFWCNTQSINIKDQGSMIATNEPNNINMLASKPLEREIVQYVRCKACKRY
jgi:hypothetical protein